MFITKDFINEILDQTNLYAHQKNVSLNVTKNELWVVFGAFLFLVVPSIQTKDFTGQKKMTIFPFYQSYPMQEVLKA